MLKEKNK